MFRWTHPFRRRPGKSLHAHWLVLALLASSCSLAPAGGPAKSTSLSADDILRDCVAAYQKLTTLQARGLLRDYRREPGRVVPISWHLEKPARARLQIDLDVAIVSGEHWWHYDAGADRFQQHRQFTRTPMETAAYLISDGVPFFQPVLFTRGAAAFGPVRAGRFEDWRLEGVAWHADVPCYVVARDAPVGRERGILRVWIDQDGFLVRGWRLSVPAPRDRERIILDCSYSEVTADARLPAEAFQLRSPTPINLFGRAATRPSD